MISVPPWPSLGETKDDARYAALSIGTLLLLTQAEEPKQDRKVIHLTEVACKTFTELTREESRTSSGVAVGLSLAGA